MALAYYGGLGKADVVRVPKTARRGGSIDMDTINGNGKELSIFEAKRLTATLNEPDDIQMGQAAKAKGRTVDKTLIGDGRHIGEHHVVVDAYYDKILPTLDRQLGVAGLRLAQLLNDIHAPRQCADR